MVTGDRDTLMQIHDSDEARMLTFKGELLLEDFSLDFFYAGDSAADYMTRYASALTAILAPRVRTGRRLRRSGGQAAARVEPCLI